MNILDGAAAPTLSRARVQAEKNGYPYFTLITSTPNGTVGTGEWFHQMYGYSVDSDMIFDEKDHIIEDVEHIVDNPERNGFVRVVFHWKMDPNKDEDWYQQQRRDLNFNTRLINQELDLLFVGSTTCIFTDEFLGSLNPTKPQHRVKLPHATMCQFFVSHLDSSDFLLIGADTAKSLVGDYCAIEIFSYRDFEQIGEFFGKLGSLTKYSEVLMALIRYLAPVMNNRLLLCIENNSIGSAIIENLENALDFDYMQFVYTPTEMKLGTKDGRIVSRPKVQAEYGINTNVRTKSIMVSALYDYLTTHPPSCRSTDFINQLNIIERRANGSISAQYGKNDDLFMAAAMCAYVRRISALEYEPLLGVSHYVNQQLHTQKLTQTLSVIGTKDIEQIANTNMIYNDREGGYEYIETHKNSDIAGEDLPFSIC